MIDILYDFLGQIPIDLVWIIGPCAIILFTFLVSFVFSLFDFLFNLIGGGIRRG